jgi:hypothetical protein
MSSDDVELVVVSVVKYIHLDCLEDESGRRSEFDDKMMDGDEMATECIL